MSRTTSPLHSSASSLHSSRGSNAGSAASSTPLVLEAWLDSEPAVHEPAGEAADDLFLELERIEAELRVREDELNSAKAREDALRSQLIESESMAEKFGSEVIRLEGDLRREGSLVVEDLPLHHTLRRCSGSKTCEDVGKFTEHDATQDATCDWVVARAALGI